jgi:F-type H+-transporting ATPase subunit a
LVAARHRTISSAGRFLASANFQITGGFAAFRGLTEPEAFAYVDSFKTFQTLSRRALHMPRATTLALLIFALAAPVSAFASDSGVSAKALPLFKIGPLPVTNSMITSWVVSLALLAAVRLAVKKPQLVPSRGQAVIETLVDALRGLFEPIVGKKAMGAAFPILLSFFVFILVHNWSGLFPGVGTVGSGYKDAAGHFHLTAPWIRPANADFNATIALAVVSFGAWLILIFKYAGPRLILHDIFGNKAEKSDLPLAMYYGLSLVFLMVGCIEILSILIRPLTLSARLYGNVYGGENLLHSTWFAPPFYFMELLVGLVQAFVFTLLSAVYIGLICNHGDDHHEESAPVGKEQAAH